MIVYRLAKGAPLSLGEIDGNFRDLHERLAHLEQQKPQEMSLQIEGMRLMVLLGPTVVQTLDLPHPALPERHIPIVMKGTLPDPQMGNLAFCADSSGTLTLIYGDGTCWRAVSGQQIIE